MRIDRELFSDNFTTYNAPEWDCPTCQKGKLHFDVENITVHETYESKKDREDKNWEPYWISQCFNGNIFCSNPKCKEAFTIAGTVNTEEDYNNEDGHSYTECYYPNYVYPIIHIFKIPQKTPSKVEDAILSAFKVFWIDKSACANAIRTIVEVILNDKKILKTELTKKKKRRSLSLHERIQLFENRNKEVTNYLMAIKWIGNAGSHEGDLANEDILDSLDLLKYAIEKLYASHDKEINKITKQINKRKKPLQ